MPKSKIKSQREQELESKEYEDRLLGDSANHEAVGALNSNMKSESEKYDNSDEIKEKFEDLTPYRADWNKVSEGCAELEQVRFYVSKSSKSMTMWVQNRPLVQLISKEAINVSADIAEFGFGKGSLVVNKQGAKFIAESTVTAGKKREFSIVPQAGVYIGCKTSNEKWAYVNSYDSLVQF